MPPTPSNGYASHLRGLDDDEVTQTKCVWVQPGGPHPHSKLISESGLYSLILKSRKPEAKIFKKWVTSEVLPSIRKTGAYSVKGRPAAEPEQPKAPCAPSAVPPPSPDLTGLLTLLCEALVKHLGCAKTPETPLPAPLMVPALPEPTLCGQLISVPSGRSRMA